MNWVANPFEFNDPFEFHLKDIFFNDNEGNFKQLDIEQIKVREDILNQINYYGVVCYSTNEHNILMWSHYADNHKGMCLVFDVPNPIDKYLFKVNYLEDLPNIKYDMKEFLPEIRKIITTKSKDWEYEQEYREVKIYKDKHSPYCGKLVEIIFGCKCTKEDIEFVINVSNANYNDIIISKKNIDKNSFKLSKTIISKVGSKYIIPELWNEKTYM
jgi:hypothetical protein